MRFSVGRAGGSAENIHYITREPATNADRQSVLVRNYPSEVTEARDYDELRDRLEEYADEQERGELDRPRRGGGETRTHYKVILSFEQEIDTEQARDMADEYLDREFPDARAVAAVHQDTDHTHVHIHIQARDADDQKLHFDRETYRELDRAWEDIYDREFGRDHQPEQEGKSVMERDRYFEDEDREEELYGRDEAGDRADEREAPDGGPQADRDERALEDSARELDRADQESREAVRAAEDAADRLDERPFDRDVDRDDYDRDLDDRGR
ncbi:MAG TPA: relaxase/mobilization nuclease domain-containing protein [Chloroflexota bacterium]|nr:relaxase/mobilization nuclease domain-containing protein [Chloroflexota bacterium]